MLILRKSLRRICLLAALALCAPHLSAAPKPPPPAPLTADGQRHLDKYTAQLAAAQAEVNKALPKIDEGKKAALQKAREALKAAESQANSTQQSQGKFKPPKPWSIMPRASGSAARPRALPRPKLR